VFHFTNLLFYNSNTKFKYIAGVYVYPYFHQNWEFFTYPPKNNFKLIVESENQTEDVLATLIAKHQKNRLAGNEAQVLTLTNLIHYFTQNISVKNGEVKNDENFNLILHFLKNYLSNKSIKKVILVTENIETKEQKIYYSIL
jgi:hypothetical protein